MSTAETIVIQCAACQQKYRRHAHQIGQIETCQKCGYQFLAIDPSAAIPLEVDDSIASRKRGSESRPAIERPVMSRESEFRLEGKRPAGLINTQMRLASSPTALQAWLVVALLIVIAAAGFAPRSQARTKWEYKIESPSDTAFETTLALYGADGWEVVSARRASDISTKNFKYELIMKRPR